MWGILLKHLTLRMWHGGARTRNTVKPYKAKSLVAAQTRVRQLQRQVADRDTLLAQFDHERKMVAKLAAETPQFYNPLVAMEAKQIRDRILALPNAQPGLLHPVVKPHSVGYHTFIASDRGHKATQVTIGREVLGLYWHCNNGFKRTAINKFFEGEADAKKAILHSAIQKRKSQLKSLTAELERLNARG